MGQVKQICLIFNDDDGFYAVDVVGHAKSESPKLTLIILLSLPSAKTLLLYHSRVSPGIWFHFLVSAIHRSRFPPEIKLRLLSPSFSSVAKKSRFYPVCGCPRAVFPIPFRRFSSDPEFRIRLRGRRRKGSDLPQIDSGFGDLWRLLLGGLIWRRYK